MSVQREFHPGNRVSYDGALCTVWSKFDHIPDTRGEWLGVEWDDPSRGKHDGTHNGVRYFQCRSAQTTVASFVRPTRKADHERTVLEAIRYKYVADPHDRVQDTVVISGKIAEEIGFDKINRKRSDLANLKIAILDSTVICGVAARASSADTIRQAQKELAQACPNVVQLDLSYNPIENWADVEEICIALPKLKILKLNGVRFRAIESKIQVNESTCFQNIHELHLNECLLTPSDVLRILRGSNFTRFPSLQTLWLSQNELLNFNLEDTTLQTTLDSIKTLMLEKNLFTTLDPIPSISSVFINVSHISLQANKIASFSASLPPYSRIFPTVQSLNLSQNAITEASFIDYLPAIFPNLSSLRVSKNPVYDSAAHRTPSSNLTSTSYYLTLARIPTLKTLNYTDITPREREEGEMYYLSTAEKEIRSILAVINTDDQATITTAIQNLTNRYPRYAPLCSKHDRDNILVQLTSPSSNPSTEAPPIQPTYPTGSLASRLIQTTFHLSPQTPPSASASPATAKSPAPTTEFTRSIPSTIPTSSVFAAVSRTLNLRPLTFKLIYESEELDPVRDDLTTRSQIYADKSLGARRWDDWGDWDADILVERSVARGDAAVDDQDGREVDGGADEGRWTDDGVLIENGRKWRKREIEVLFGARSWGDWLESGVRTCRVRVELVGAKK